MAAAKLSGVSPFDMAINGSFRNAELAAYFLLIVKDNSIFKFIFKDLRVLVLLRASSGAGDVGDAAGNFHAWQRIASFEACPPSAGARPDGINCTFHTGRETPCKYKFFRWRKQG